NTVTVNAADDEGDPASANASDTATYQDVTPSISITKSHTGTLNEGTAGQALTYSFTMTNTSTASTDPVTVTSLSDTVLGDLLPAFKLATGGIATIGFGGAVTLPPNYTAPLPYTTLFLSNTVTVNAADDEGDPASANASDTATYQDVTPSISITKSHTG